MAEAKQQFDDNSYDANQITALEETEAVRMRPGMYIGPTDINGLHHMIREVVDNSVDEALAGFADAISITIKADASITVVDNGRGIPVDIHPKHNVSALELAATKLHAGGKFGQGGYKVSSGLHGVGLSVVNALSEWMRIEVRRHGRLWMQKYLAGKPQAPVKDIADAEGTGSSISFLPDVKIFKDGLDYNFRVLAQRFREMAYLTKGLRFHFLDERTGNEVNFYFEGGVISYVRHLNKDKNALHRVPFYVERTVDDVAVEVAMQYTDNYDTDSVYNFANNINNTDGGAHLTGFRTALTRVINSYARSKSMLKENDANLTGDDVREGLTAVISVKLKDPQFSSQTKEKLVSPEAASAVATVVSDALSSWLEENPGDARRIIEKAVSAARTRLAVQKVRETARKSAMEGLSLPGKLADCSDTNPARCELYIVEGDSAGGCLAPETAIPLASGLVKTMQELADDWERGIQHFGYASNAEGDIRIVPLVHPRLTKRDAELVEVELDNGERIRCTPDHPFRLRDGTYRAASALQPNESLMPLKTRLTSAEELPGPGYEMVWMNAHEQWWHTHHLADLYNMLTGVYTRKAGNTRHHKDFNKLNNDPRNIERMPWRDHQRLHAELAGEMARRLWQDPDYRKRKLKQLSEQARQQWQDPAYRQYMRERVKLQRQDAVLNEKLLQDFQDWFASLTAEEYAAYCERMREMQAAYWASPEHRRLQAERTRRFFEENPQAKEQRREAAVAQWENAELRAWRSEKTRQQWEDETYCHQHSTTVRQWWQEHPEHREKIVAARQRGWADEQTRERILTTLAGWRESTSTEEKGARIRAGHRLKALSLLNQVLDATNIRQAYEQQRPAVARTAPSYDRLLDTYFEGDEQQMHEAATLVNCKVVAVRPLEERTDVYDLTVEGYHNFALASGVFVHNSAKQGRDRRFQAILPLRGKILNVEKSRIDKMLSNAEVKAMITAIGAAIGEQFSTDKLRYHRILIMTDADVDGSHIRTLLLTFFFRYMRPLIANGHLYIAQPPLYRIKHGKQQTYVYSDNERDEYLKQISDGTKVDIQRYKGLGEMNPDQLWETTMNPTNRVVLQVTLEDAQKADETFTMLMGDLVLPRRKFIQAHATEVRNLDV
ncbi:MAG: DNA topoisomerase (ATP-hydrolyzing) subunit B [Chloroflexaceae bacterium]